MPGRGGGVNLSGDDEGVVEGGHEDHAVADGSLLGVGRCLVEVVTDEDHLGAKALDAVDFDGGGDGGHGDNGAATKMASAHRDSLGMVACRGSYYSTG